MKSLFNSSIALLILTMGNLAVQAQESEAIKVAESQIQVLQDSLESMIQKRWSQKELWNTQLESENRIAQELEGRNQETAIEAGRLEEKSLQIQAGLGDLRTELETRSRAIEDLRRSVIEAARRNADLAGEAFPTDREAELLRWSELDRTTTTSRSAKNSLDRLLTESGKDLQFTSGVQVTTKDWLLPDGRIQSVTEVRLDDVMAFGIQSQGVEIPVVWTIRQTGMQGVGRYAMDSVPSALVCSQLQEFTGGKSKNIGWIPADILLNHQSGVLYHQVESSLWTQVQKWFVNGGALMWAILLCAVVSLLLTFKKLWQFMRARRFVRKGYASISKDLDVSDWQKAEDHVKGLGGVVPRILHSALLNRNHERFVAERAVKEVLVEEVPVLESSLSTLAVMASAAPLLGLLGTVIGMIDVFQAITEFGTGDPKLLAGGISVALITTQAGLVVAIPVLLLHNWLNNQSQEIQAQMHRHALKILNRMWPEAK